MGADNGFNIFGNGNDMYINYGFGTWYHFQNSFIKNITQSISRDMIGINSFGDLCGRKYFTGLQSIDIDISISAGEFNIVEGVDDFINDQILDSMAISKLLKYINKRIRK